MINTKVTFIKAESLQCFLYMVDGEICLLSLRLINWHYEEQGFRFCLQFAINMSELPICCKTIQPLGWASTAPCEDSSKLVRIKLLLSQFLEHTNLRASPNPVLRAGPQAGL